MAIAALYCINKSYSCRNYKLRKEIHTHAQIHSQSSKSYPSMREYLTRNSRKGRECSCSSSNTKYADKRQATSAFALSNNSNKAVLVREKSVSSELQLIFAHTYRTSERVQLHSAKQTDKQRVSFALSNNNSNGA